MTTAEILQQMKKKQNENSEETFWKEKTNYSMNTQLRKNLFKDMLSICEDIFKMMIVLLFSMWKEL